MHEEHRAVLKPCKAAFECLESPILSGFRIAEQDRIVELNNLAAGRDQRGDFMMDGVGVVEGKLSSIAPVIFIRHAISDGAGPRKADLGDALGVLLREQKLLQNQRLLVA